MNKLEKEMERRRLLHNKENTNKTIQILQSIEHNKQCMKLYQESNSSFDKIRLLLVENIHLYNSLKAYRQIQKYKPIQTKEIKKEVLESEFDNYVSRDTTIETFDIDWELNFNLVTH